MRQGRREDTVLDVTSYGATSGTTSSATGERLPGVSQREAFLADLAQHLQAGWRLKQSHYAPTGLSTEYQLERCH